MAQKRVFRKSHLSPFLAALLLSCDSLPKNALAKCESVAVVSKPVRTDILFVIDDSGSMREEQQNLADNFDAFINKLASSTVKNEFQIGVTTTAVDLRLRSSGGTTTLTSYSADATNPNQNTPYPRGALIAVDATGKYVTDKPRILTADMPKDQLIADFRAYSKVGIFGSGKEQGLEAIRMALVDRIADGVNAGFLRPGARLAIIVVTDEDDCSDPEGKIAISNLAPVETCHSDASKAAVKPVQDYVNVLKGQLGGEQKDVVVALIAGIDPITKQPAICSTAYDKADRYKALTDAFGKNALVDSICNNSFRATLEAIAGLLDPGQNLALDGAPSDHRLLLVNLIKANGTRLKCKIAIQGDADLASADAIYSPPEGERGAALTFQNQCRLEPGDSVDLKIVCAG